MRHSSEIDMCSGPLVGSLLRFSLPLMASGILQLLFNAADIIVLGQFASSSAMAAVGATSSLNSLMVNLFLGLSIGCSVVMAHSYGAQDWRRVQDTVHTAILLALFCGAALILLGLPLLPVLLGWMDTPADLMDQSVLYMRIVFLGMPAMMAYDFGAGILRAIGDTRRPLFFLTAAGITNACLNVFFVLVFHMDVAGVALATSISQYLSAGLILRCLARPGTRYQLHPRQLRLHKATLLQILRVGLPAGIQSVVFSVSNVLIQSSINSFGTLAVAGSTAAANIENFVYTAMESVYQAALNFTSQNIGAGKKERVPLILRDCLLLVAVIGAILGGPGGAVRAAAAVHLHLGSPGAALWHRPHPCGLPDLSAVRPDGRGLRGGAGNGRRRHPHGGLPDRGLRAAHRLDLHGVRVDAQPVRAVPVLSRHLDRHLYHAYGVLCLVLPPAAPVRRGHPAHGVNSTKGPPFGAALFIRTLPAPGRA